MAFSFVVLLGRCGHSYPPRLRSERPTVLVFLESQVSPASDAYLTALPAIHSSPSHSAMDDALGLCAAPPAVEDVHVGSGEADEQSSGMDPTGHSIRRLFICHWFDNARGIDILEIGMLPGCHLYNIHSIR